MNIQLLINRFRKSHFLLYLKRIAVISFPVFLYFIPMNWLTQQHTICLFKNFFDIECFGCGITRAVISATQLDFINAFNYNKLIVIVFPLLIFAWLRIVIALFKSNTPK